MPPTTRRDPLRRLSDDFRYFSDKVANEVDPELKAALTPTLAKDRSLVNIALKSRVFDPKVAKRVDADLLAYRQESKSRRQRREDFARRNNLPTEKDVFSYYRRYFPNAPRTSLIDGGDANIRYDKGAPIGKGNFGQVFLGARVDLTTGKCTSLRAIKMISYAGNCPAETTRKQELIHKESKRMGEITRLGQRNLVQYYSFSHVPAENKYALIMEYVQGCPLAGWLRQNGPFSERLLRHVTKQILMGLRALHSHDIIHRDLSTNNIVLDVNYRIKIIDFGLSKHTWDPPVNGRAEDNFISQIGIPYYMPPEVNARAAGWSTKSDIWALGVVLIWVGFGDAAIQRHFQELPPYYNGITPHYPPMLSAIPGYLGSFLRDCLRVRARPSAYTLSHHMWIMLEAKIFSDLAEYVFTINDDTYASTAPKPALEKELGITVLSIIQVKQ